MSSSAFSSNTASRPWRVQVSTSISERSEVEKAGTCEYTQAASRWESTAETVFTINDSSQRSGYILQKGWRLSAAEVLLATIPRTKRTNDSSFSAVRISSEPY